MLDVYFSQFGQLDDSIIMVDRDLSKCLIINLHSLLT